MAGSGLGALVTCLKQAKSLGLLRTLASCEGHGAEGSCLWNGVVPLTAVQQALCHRDDQVMHRIIDTFVL